MTLVSLFYNAYLGGTNCSVTVRGATRYLATVIDMAWVQQSQYGRIACVRITVVNPLD